MSTGKIMTMLLLHTRRGGFHWELPTGFPPRVCSIGGLNSSNVESLPSLCHIGGISRCWTTHVLAALAVSEGFSR